MGIRFRKTITIAPGIRINLSKSGVSATVGPKGATLGIGKGGVHANVGIPGSGIFYRKKLPLPWPGGSKKTGSPSGSSTSSTGRTQEGRSDAEEMNLAIQEIIDIHLRTLQPAAPLVYTPSEYGEPVPALPPSPFPLWLRGAVLVAALVLLYFTKGLSFIPWALWEGYIYYSRKKNHAVLMADWEQRKAAFEREDAKKAVRFEEAMKLSGEKPETALEAVVSAIEWPRETHVSFQVDGQMAFLDVDLPEIEDMPAVTYGFSSRSGITEDQKSETQIRKDYARHVHGVAFLLLGEVFRALPSISEIVLSGYTQKIQSATGREEDQYLYSLRVHRDQWKDINFSALDIIDPVEAIGGFEIRRNMTKTGIFKEIEPFTL